MSSPRPAPKPLNMPTSSFGETPAAIYLAHYLNDKGDKVLARKVGRKLSKWRTVMNDVIASHTQTDEMLASTFGTLLQLLDNAVRESVMLLPDPLCQNLVANILVGELKTWKRRAHKRYHVHRKVQKSTPEGETIPDTKVMYRVGDETLEETAARLRRRSAEYLARRKKVNTLY